MSFTPWPSKWNKAEAMLHDSPVFRSHMHELIEF